jgi:hypothetical protein
LKTANRANQVAESIARVEQDRWHTELTPKFEAEIDHGNSNAQQLKLVLRLIGPIGLDRLDEIVLSIRNDRMREPSQLADSPTQEQIDQVVWGRASSPKGWTGPMVGL